MTLAPAFTVGALIFNELRGKEMAKGFFKTSELASKKIKNKSRNAHCEKCKLYKNCKNPRMKPEGERVTKILHVGNYPGLIEDRKNEHFKGSAAKLYKRCLRKAGINLDDGLKTYANTCCPFKEKVTKTQIKACHPNLKKCIEEFQPHVIIALGENAIESLTMHKSNKSIIGGLSTCRGFIIPDREYNAWICPTFDPNYIIKENTPEAAEKIFVDDLTHAAQMINVPLPYHSQENELDKIEILKHPKETILWLKKMMGFPEQKFMTAFDYEGSGLKPQHKDHYIRTCSISLGPDHAVAFPFFNDNQEFLIQFSRYLAATDIMKVAANIQFENTWSNVKLGMNINGWLYDTMLGMHSIDNRPRVTSLEKMNYFLLGIEPYDEHIKEYLKSEEGRGNSFNSIHKADLKDLLLYNGMDSLTEFRQAIIGMELNQVPYKRYYNDKENPSAQEIAPQLFNRE